MEITGKIISTFSESTNGAPVVVTHRHGRRDRSPSPFERRLWNDFFHAHADRIRRRRLPGRHQGEPWEASIRCCDDCLSLQPGRVAPPAPLCLGW